MPSLPSEPTDTPCTILLHLAPRVSMERQTGHIVFTGTRSTLSIQVAEAQGVFWDSLTGPGFTTAELHTKLAAGPAADRIPLFLGVDQLVRQGFLCHSLTVEGRAVASRIVISRRFVPAPALAEVRYALSRFACCRVQDGELLLESPRCHAQVLLHDWRCSALLTTFAEREKSSPCGISPQFTRALEIFLAETGLLIPIDDRGQTEEEKNDSLRQWEFADLLFHARSREGRHASPIVGTYPFRDLIPPPPPLKPSRADTKIELDKADLELLLNEDTPFTRVLESRRSRRENGNQPLSIRQLGEFFYRAARVQRWDEKSGTSWRPYPSGGGLHELELYLVVDRCEGLPRGVYYYAPLHHHLEPLNVEPRGTIALLEHAARTQGTTTLPSVLIVVTARFPRVTWKYGSISYALILKNVGGLMQTLYLVATAMGIAPCAIGVGDSDLFGRVTGLDYETEGAVGEFTLR